MTLTQIKQIQLKAPAKIIVVAGITLSLLMTPLVFAWDAKVSASSQCDRSGVVEIAISYTNEFNKAADVVATDKQTQISINLGSIQPNETKTGDIVTGKSHLDSGTVVFKITNAGGETKQADYAATNACQGPTPTPTQTPTTTPTTMPSPTPTCTPTPQPTATPTPTQIPTPTPTSMPSDTPTPQPTSTPVPTTPPTNNNTNNNSNQNNQNQDVTQNSNPTINITNDNNPNISNNNNITIQNAQTQQVLGASVTVQPATQATSLPSTGPETNVVFGLLSLIPTGFGLRKLSRKS